MTNGETQQTVKNSHWLNLFQNLIWPAVAGNVAWSFFTVAVQECWCDEGVQARLVVLVSIAVYLGIDWMRTEARRENLKPGFWYFLFDSALAAAIAVFAIAVQNRVQSAPSWGTWALVAVLAVTTLGHILGVWEAAGSADPSDRGLLAIFNIAGIVVVVIGHCGVIPGFAPWNLPVAVLVVIGMWAIMRFVGQK